MRDLYSLLTNKIILSVIFGFLASQSVKFIIYSVKQKKLFYPLLYRMYGDMPSTHTSIISSLLFSAYFLEGISTLFIVVLIFSLFILADLIEAKMFYAERDKVLNSIIKRANLHGKKKLPSLNTWVGHSVLEILAGIILGFIIAYAVFYVA